MERPFQAYEGDEPYVFVCYSHEDDALVYAELGRLREAGFNVWYDEGISPGSQWSDVIARHIERCAVLLYFVTPRSVVSEHCRREVNFALEQSCGMLAVHLERTNLPSGLKLTLSNRQAILKYDEPATIYTTKLSQAIRGAAEHHDVQETARSSALTLGDWTLDVGTQRLIRGDESHVLDPKALSVLLHLIDRAPEVTSRDGLIDRTWPDVVVGDNVLDQAIAQLRRALGDDARNPRYIETLPRRGYRLIAMVEPQPEVAHDGVSMRSVENEAGGWTVRWAWLAALGVAVAIAVGLATQLVNPPTSEVLDRSVAVLPLSVVGDDSAVATDADALTEELRTEVARYEELRTVAAPHAATSPRDVPEASYALGGNVQLLGDRLRLRARLTRTADLQTVWSQTFERPVADVIADPAQLASTAARFARLQLVVDQQCEAVRRSSAREEAVAAYCAALAQSYRFAQAGNADFSLVLSSAQRALALDPNIADAYGIVADAFSSLAFAGQSDWRQAAREARAAVDHGLSLAPEDPRLLHAQGSVQYYLDLDYKAAKASYLAALASDPISPGAYATHMELGNVALTQGKISEALEHAELALRMYDSDAGVYVLSAGALHTAGHHRDAIEVADAGLKLVQSGYNRLYLIVIKAAAQSALGESQSANATLDDGLASVGRGLRMFFIASLARLGRTKEARELLAELEAREHPSVMETWAMIMAYATMDRDRAFDSIHSAIDHHILSVILTLRWDANYSELRKDPRWNEVMRHLEAEEARTRAGNSG